MIHLPPHRSPGATNRRDPGRTLYYCSAVVFPEQDGRKEAIRDQGDPTGRAARLTSCLSPSRRFDMSRLKNEGQKASKSEKRSFFGGLGTSTNLKT